MMMSFSRSLLRIQLVSAKQRIKNHASLINLFSHLPPHGYGTHDEWRSSAIENLVQLKIQYTEALRNGDLSIFYESIAGDTVIYNEQRQGFFVANDATLLDILYELYGERAFHMKKVTVRRFNQKIDFTIDDLARSLEPGDQIIKFSGPKIQFTVQPHWCDIARTSRVQAACVNKLGELAAIDHERQAAIELRGEQVIQRLFDEAWKNHLGHEPHIDSEAYLTIPLHYITPRLSKVISTEQRFLLAAGLNQVPNEQMRPVIDALVEFRKGVLCFEAHVDDRVGTLSEIVYRLQQAKINNIQVIGRANMRQGGTVLVWFHENQIADQQSFQEIKRQLKKHHISISRQTVREVNKRLRQRRTNR